MAGGAWVLLLAPVLLILRVFGSRDPALRALRGARLCRLWSKGLLRVWGVTLFVQGEPPPGGAFAVSNHVSWLDILTLASASPSTYIAKDEIARWPFLGWLARLMDTLFIDRERARDAVRLGGQLRLLLEQGVTITMFAEGRSWNGTEILPFKSALFEVPAALQVACVPVAVTYRNPGAPGASTICWWKEMPLLEHIVGVLKLPRIECTVSYGEPVRGIRDRKKLAAELHRRVEALFVPVPD
ncbi:MAG: lysophospholipid acyltransferase family protein [Planctomycetota bacterium]